MQQQQVWATAGRSARRWSGILRNHEAPELRALYATAFPGPGLVEETKRAVNVLKTPLTMCLHGFALGQVEGGDGGLDYLMRALHMAEAFEDVDQVVAAATDICNYHVRRGGYLEAHEWAQWALYQHNSGGSRDAFASWPRLAYSCIRGF